MYRYLCNCACHCRRFAGHSLDGVPFCYRCARGRCPMKVPAVSPLVRVEQFRYYGVMGGEGSGIPKPEKELLSGSFTVRLTVAEVDALIRRYKTRKKATVAIRELIRRHLQSP